LFYHFFLYSFVVHRHLHSFPTRRSSDLFHLPVIYLLSIPVAVSVTSNTTNMLDPLNGTMAGGVAIISAALLIGVLITDPAPSSVDRKSTRLNSSHVSISYAVFCLKKKNT